MTQSKPDREKTAAAASGKTNAATSGKTKAAPKDKPHSPAAATDSVPPREVGGRDGPEPTRFGDWEKNGRCVDF